MLLTLIEWEKSLLSSIEDCFECWTADFPSLLFPTSIHAKGHYQLRHKKSHPRTTALLFVLRDSPCPEAKHRLHLSPDLQHSSSHKPFRAGLAISMGDLTQQRVPEKHSVSSTSSTIWTEHLCPSASRSTQRGHNPALRRLQCPWRQSSCTSTATWGWNWTSQWQQLFIWWCFVKHIF